MKIDGIVETALHVEDVGRSAEFYRAPFRTAPPGRRRSILRVCRPGKCRAAAVQERWDARTRCVTPGGMIPPHDGSGRMHFAFKISAGSLEICERELAASGNSRSRAASIGRCGGTSLYFRDPDRAPGGTDYAGMLGSLLKWPQIHADSRMNMRTLVSPQSIYYWRTNLAVILGVATAVAVLSGALLVGDSVRDSLRDLVLARLARRKQWFPARSFSGTAFRRSARFRADDRDAGNVSRMRRDRTARGECLNLRRRRSILEVSRGCSASLSYRRGFERRPGARTGRGSGRRDSDCASKSRLRFRSNRCTAAKKIRAGPFGFDVGATLDANQLGEFSLQPTQGDVFAVFVPLRRLQRDLVEPNRVNTLLLAVGHFSE